MRRSLLADLLAGVCLAALTGALIGIATSPGLEPDPPERAPTTLSSGGAGLALPLSRGSTDMSYSTAATTSVTCVYGAGGGSSDGGGGDGSGTIVYGTNTFTTN